jgi:hypothetical protein
MLNRSRFFHSDHYPLLTTLNSNETALRYYESEQVILSKLNRRLTDWIPNDFKNLFANKSSVAILAQGLFAQQSASEVFTAELCNGLGLSGNGPEDIAIACGQGIEAIQNTISTAAGATPHTTRSDRRRLPDTAIEEEILTVRQLGHQLVSAGSAEATIVRIKRNQARRKIKSHNALKTNAATALKGQAKIPSHFEIDGEQTSDRSRWKLELEKQCNNKYTDPANDIHMQVDRIQQLQAQSRSTNENYPKMRYAHIFEARSRLSKGTSAGGKSPITGNVARALPYTIIILIAHIFIARYTSNDILPLESWAAIILYFIP